VTIRDSLEPAYSKGLSEQSYIAESGIKQTGSSRTGNTEDSLRNSGKLECSSGAFSQRGQAGMPVPHAWWLETLLTLDDAGRMSVTTGLVVDSLRCDSVFRIRGIYGSEF
jgi:hypothetical protein